MIWRKKYALTCFTYTNLRCECKMSPSCSCFWTLCLQLVVLSQEVGESLGQEVDGTAGRCRPSRNESLKVIHVSVPFQLSALGLCHVTKTDCPFLPTSFLFHMNWNSWNYEPHKPYFTLLPLANCQSSEKSSNILIKPIYSTQELYEIITTMLNFSFYIKGNECGRFADIFSFKLSWLGLWLGSLGWVCLSDMIHYKFLTNNSFFFFDT